MKTSQFLLFTFLLTISISKLNAQGTLWGETSNGGATGGGTVFKTNYDGTGFTKIKDFVLDVPGNNPNSRLSIGPSPNLNGKLYGYSIGSGTYSLGLIFQYDPATNAYTNVFDFDGTNGATPEGALLLYGTKFYGVTYNGGINGAGTLFEFDPATNSLTKKVDFQLTSTGGIPSGYLTLFNNKLYGTTSNGGANNAGTIFEFDPAAALGSNIVKKYDFNNTDGGVPLGELTVSGSRIYGTALVGGANNKGVIYEFDPAGAAGSNYVKKVDFDGATLGSDPRTGLVLVSGTMYGIANGGGANSSGTIYTYVPGATNASKKEDLPSSNYVSYGTGTLLYANGLLYGNTLEYMFSYDPTQPTGSGFTKVRDYDYYSTGTDVLGGFTLAPSGKIYGLAGTAGLAQAGAIIEYDPTVSVTISNPPTNPQGRIYFNTSSGS
ncbi:MAG TPA: choice-of-anchor tandem repeat GloVer-containing protein, partial [Cyclobacteriaceae bacterium]|nr:choice-of-anchor tandem repeat GloVer-containing protein [Cyclobacteriaceae bacterium]